MEGCFILKFAMITLSFEGFEHAPTGSVIVLLDCGRVERVAVKGGLTQGVMSVAGSFGF